MSCSLLGNWGHRENNAIGTAPREIWGFREDVGAEAPAQYTLIACTRPWDFPQHLLPLPPLDSETIRPERELLPQICSAGCSGQWWAGKC